MMSIAAARSHPVLRRNNVQVSGLAGARPVLFAHGFGCSQDMWRSVTPGFEPDNEVVLFDLVGAGDSDLSAYDRGRYDSLHGYADDVLEILEALDLSDVVYVGHSVSAVIGVLAAIRDPSRFGALVLVGPSPCYLNDGDYIGGFELADIEGLLDNLDANYLGWSSAMGPVIMGNPDRPELAAELTDSFCRTDPAIASHFARVTFLSDNRGDLPQVTTPTLVVQCSDDAIAPLQVGGYVHDAIEGSELTVLSAVGHCPHLSAPDELTAAIHLPVVIGPGVVPATPATTATVAESYEDRYEHAPCGLLSIDEGGVIVETNVTFRAWSGYPAKDLVGREFLRLLDVGSRLFWDTRCLPVLQLEGSVREVAVKLVCHDGNTLPVLLNCSIQDLPGSGQRTRIALFDASQRVDYERELLNARRVAERSAARVQVLQQASATFDTASSVTAIADGLARAARTATDAGSAAVLLTEPGRQQRRIVSSGSPPFGEAATRDDSGPEAAAMRSGEILALGGREALEQAYPARAGAWHAERVESVVVVPLRGGGGGLGVLLCGFGRRREFGEDDLELLRTLARQTVQALQRLGLEQQLLHEATHDRLTGLANRALLHERLEQALAAADRHHRPLALVFLDLDEFKPINDRLGHAAGDAVLVEVGARLQDVCRTADTVARFGGDEFVILCEDTDVTTIQPLAERIRDALGDPLTGRAVGCTVGASIGVAVHGPSDEATPEPDAVLLAADAAMYTAKHAGKDRVHVTSI